MGKSKKINTISLFAGGGGLDLGFSSSGFHIRLAIDIDPYSCMTLSLNENKRSFFKNCIVLNKDIKEVTPEFIDKRFDGIKLGIDAIIGGPPCQAFSVFGKRKGLNDPRGNLVWDYIRLLRYIKPHVFVFENVSGLKTIHNGELYTQLIEELSCDGLYVVSDHNYELADYGIPQFRSRIFFIGVKNGHRIPPMTKTHGLNGDNVQIKPFVTAGKVLCNLPEPDQPHNLPNHKGRNHSQRIIDRYSGLKFGERDHHTRINKIDPDRPSFTIIVGSDKGGGKGHIHPYTPREVTPRESARIQTFPDWWEFAGNGRHVIRQVGNAVPPLFAAQLAQHIRKHVFGQRQINSYKEIINRLELNYMLDQ